MKSEIPTFSVNIFRNIQLIVHVQLQNGIARQGSLSLHYLVFNICMQLEACFLYLVCVICPTLVSVSHPLIPENTESTKAPSSPPCVFSCFREEKPH